MKEMIEEAVKNFKKEAKVIDKMLSFAENNQENKFIMFTNYFKTIKEKSDNIIKDILDKYSIEDIVMYVIDNFSEDKDELMALLTFAGLSDCEYINRVGRELFNADMDSFAEEHYRTMLSIYLWGIKNEEMTEEERKALHDFMMLNLTSSQFVRNYFSGDYENALNISSPEKNFGETSANEMALNSYYSYLNKLVHDSNTFEMFDQMESKDIFNARKRILKYEIVALCTQIENRGFSYPYLQIPMSDFTEDILADSSRFNEEYKKRKELKPKSVIRL